MLGHLRDVAAGCPPERERAKTARWKGPCFKWLCLRSHTRTSAIFPLVTENHAGTVWKEGAPGHEHQEVRVLGDHLEGWLPQ